jgi:hypothetical protein
VVSGGGIWCAALLLLLPAPVDAQGDRASIVGQVTDSSGAVLPGVTVEASSPQLIEQTRSVITDDAGRYAVVDLRPGTYAVTMSLPGFRTVRREGIVLEGAFAAQVNASLSVGALEETVTVTGASPVVDVQNTQVQFVVNREVLDVLPAGRTMQTGASLVPGVISYNNSSPGRVLSTFYINTMSVHGSPSGDQHMYFDGMRVGNMLTGAGSQAIAGGVNDLGQTELVYDVGSHSAETPNGGVRMDAIPREGGNTLSGVWRTFGSNGRFQNDNMTSELRDAGVQAIDKLDYNWDTNIAVGGPIVRNRLWYFGALKLAKFNVLASSVFFPDGRQADSGGHVEPNGTSRLTSQVTRRGKLSVGYNYATALVDRSAFDSTTSPEAGLRVASPINYAGQVKWTMTATSRLLVEAGQSIGASTYHWEYQPEAGPYDVQHLEATTGFRTVANASAPVRYFNRTLNTIANVSYVTGSHAFKTGLNFSSGYQRTIRNNNGDMVVLTFLNGRSSSVNVRNSPLTTFENLNADLGLFAQDKWTIGRLTVNAGARLDYLNASVPAQSALAGRFVPARQTDQVPCTPCWTDWAIRTGLSYDLFGTGRTALKGAISKFVGSQALGLANNVNPLQVQTESRAWNDLDGNGSALDANGNAQYDEIGPSRNANFGLPRGATRLDSETPRPTNWEGSVSLVQELWPRVSFTGSYYRRQFYDSALTRNLLVDPDLDYTAFTIVAPSDPRLPDGGGEVITRYNLNPPKLGAVENVSTFSSANTRVYNGFEASVNARLPGGAFVFGGVTTERTATNDCDVANSNPNNRRFCVQVPPYRTLFKMSAASPLPYGVQISGSFQSRPGSEVAANYTFNSAIAGVPLTGGGNLTVNLVDPTTMYLDHVNTTDMRVARTFRVGRHRIQGFVEIFNVVNASTILSVNETYGQQWLRPLLIMQGRRFQFGGQLDF